MGQLKAAKLTHFSPEPLPGLTITLQLLLIKLSGDVHSNPGPVFPCPVCTRNVTYQGVSYKCNRCAGWVHKKCSGNLTEGQYRNDKNWTCSACLQPPPQSPPPTPPTPPKNDSFTVLQLNANGIGNKLVELGVLMEKENVKVAAIQESKLSTRSKTPFIQNYTTVRKDRAQGQGGGLVFFIHNSISFTKRPSQSSSSRDPHLEELTISVTVGNTDLLITNVYIPPTSSCSSGYQPKMEHLVTSTDSLVLGDFNAHHTSWHSRSTDTRGRNLADIINGSDFGILNWDTPTRVPSNAEPSSPDVSLASASFITSSHWQTLTSLSSDHLPILIRLQMSPSPSPASRHSYVNLKKADWKKYAEEVDAELSKRDLPTDCQKHEKIFRAVLLKAASHHIPTGRHRVHQEPTPAEILTMMEDRDKLRSRDPSSPELPQKNTDIQKAIRSHKQKKWIAFVETLDRKTDVTKLWRTIKAIDGKAPKASDNEAISFRDSPVSSPSSIANKFNQQFTTSKLGKHSSSSETRKVSREAKKKPLEEATVFTTELVSRAIKSCSNSKAFGPDKLSIFHLKHLGPVAMKYLTVLFNDSMSTSRIPTIWKSSVIIPILKPGKDSSLGTSYRPISLLCPAAKVLETLILPSVNTHLHPSDDQHGFRSGHSTTSALLQLSTDIATGFNRKTPPDRTICVCVDLTAAFDTVCHNTLITKICQSSLPPSTARWLSCYLRGRQAVTSFRGARSNTRNVHAGVPQGSKLSPSLFSFYIADMPRPTPPAKRVCYADDITVWASGVKVPELEACLTSYLEEVSNYLRSNSLLISAPKSSVTLFTPETRQAMLQPQIEVEGSILPLVKCPKILGVQFDTMFSFNKHCEYVADRISARNNILKALAGTTWGQQKETLLMTYKALGRSIANYATPVWSPNSSDSSIKKIQTAQNEALRVATGSHLMSAIDHLHSESEMLKVKDHSELLSTQFLAKCLDNNHPCHNITRLAPPPRRMKETLLSRHITTTEPLMKENTRATLRNIHTHLVNRSMDQLKENVVLHDRAPPISKEELELTRKQRTTLSQLRSGHCKLLGAYQSRIKKDESINICGDCGASPHDVLHLFDCTAHPTNLLPTDLWNKPAEMIREFSYLDDREAD